jgi:transposase
MRINSNDLKKWKSEDVRVYVKDPVEAFGITCLLEPMHALSVQIKKIEKAALSRGRLRPEFAPLETVWGVGKILALTIMYEVGDVARFRKVGNFTSYCRLVNTARLSAGKRKGSGNRKNGNPYLSWAFSEAAHHAVRHYPEAQKYFQRKRAKTNGIIAIRALAHKLARASYHVMRDHVDFDPEKTFA